MGEVKKIIFQFLFGARGPDPHKGVSKKEERGYIFLKILFFFSFFAFGLFYESASCIFCGIYGLFFLYLSLSRKKLVFYCNLESLALALICVCYFAAAFYGVDTGMGWIGFLKMLTVFFFLCCAMQLAEDEREGLLRLVPLAGCVMSVIGILSYATKLGYGFFYAADRFGGFFQYANVFALFCLVGILVLAKEWEEGKIGSVSFLELFLLAAGILLSGSRTVAFLTLSAGFFLFVWGKRTRAPAIALLCSIALAGIYAWMTGNVQNIGRFLTASLHSSTLVGRLLYAKDGLRLLAAHPFGLGYLGYYFMEPSIQTGVYSVRYIHNDFLQMALDIGVLPALLFMSLLIKNIFGRGERKIEKLILAVLALHCLADFDLAFTGIWFLLLLTLDIRRGKECNMAEGGKAAFHKALVGSMAACALYTGLAMLPEHFGNHALSVKLLPFDTEAKKELLAQETDASRAEGMAEDLLRQNSCVPEAYDVLAAVAYQKGDYLKMAEYKKQSVRLQKYNMDAYNRYIILLSHGISEAGAKGNASQMMALMEEVAEARDILEEVEETTDPLAYKIRDVPEFALSQEIEDYITQIEGQIGE